MSTPTRPEGHRGLVFRILRTLIGLFIALAFLSVTTIILMMVIILQLTGN